MTMGKEWHKVKYKGMYCDDYEPSIKNKINKEIKASCQKENKNIFL